MEIESIRFTVPASAEYYGSSATEKDAERASGAIAKLISEFAPKEFPNTRITVSIVPEVMSWGNRSHIETAEEIIKSAEDATSDNERETFERMEWFAGHVAETYNNRSWHIGRARAALRQEAPTCQK